MAEPRPPELTRSGSDEPVAASPDGAARRSPFRERAIVAIGIALLLWGPLALSTIASVDKGGWTIVPAAVAFAWVGATLLMLTSRTWGGFFAASAPVALLAPAFAWYFAAFREFPDDNAAIVLMTSTFDEALGWLDVLRIWPWLAAWALLAGVYAWIAARTWRQPMPRALRRWQALSIGPALALALVLPVRGADGALGVAPPDALYVHLTSSYPLGGWLSTTAAWKEAMHATGAAVDKRPYGARYEGGDDVPETHVVVVGESARYDAFGINGYARDTSAPLEGFADLVTYSNAYAPANITYLSVPMMLTGIAPEAYRREDVRGTIVDAMREAGYRTAWLSNQELYVARLLAPPADRWCVPADLERTGWERTRPDGALLPCVDDELAVPAVKRFVVVHTYGSHWDYAKRLPDGAFRYSALTRAGAAAGMSAAPDPDRLRRDLYDDTIRYTSAFLAELIARLERVPGRVSLTYLSDHGESFRPSEGVAGHGLARFSVAEMHVPLFFWANERLRQDRATAWRHLVAHRTAPVRGDALFATVATLAGVTIPGANRRSDLASETFEPFADRADIAMLCGGRLVRLADAVDWPPH
jgi:glucan phosphoethanolaminetransferase (alkaline phosphatase superfamily)